LIFLAEKKRVNRLLGRRSFGTTSAALFFFYFCPKSNFSNFMRKLFAFCLSAYCAAILFSCSDSNTSKPTTASAEMMSAESREYVRRKCLDEAGEHCVEFNIKYPVFAGGDVAAAVNKSVQDYLLSAVGGDAKFAFEVALDSAYTRFEQMYEQDRKDIPEIAMGYSTQISCAVSYLNKKVATVQMEGYSFTGGAHGNPFGSITSYDLKNNGKPLGIKDFVQDTNAVRPLLETAYKISKGLKASDPLTDVTYPEMTQLPMPANVGVAAEGIRFYYNAYEVAPYAVGPADIVLPWETLGTLADRQKWVD
jgi:hypothetical protein